MMVWSHVGLDIEFSGNSGISRIAEGPLNRFQFGKAKGTVAVILHIKFQFTCSQVVSH